MLLSVSSRLTNSDKLLKDKDSTLERQSFSQLIMEEDVFPMDKVPKVEPKIETESEAKMKSDVADENSKFSFSSSLKFTLVKEKSNERLFSDKNIHLNNDEKQKIPRLPDTTNKVPINSVSSLRRAVVQLFVCLRSRISSKSTE